MGMRRGYSLMEIVVAVGLMMAFVSSIVAASHFELRAVDESARKGKAAFLLEEGLEAVRVLRDRGWSDNIGPLVSGATYYPVFSINWKVVAADPGPIDGLFTRTVVFDDVWRRDADSDIVDVSSGDAKTIDPNTKRVTVTVAWPGPGGAVRQESVSTYLANIFQN